MHGSNRMSMYLERRTVQGVVECTRSDAWCGLNRCIYPRTGDEQVYSIFDEPNVTGLKGYYNAEFPTIVCCWKFFQLGTKRVEEKLVVVRRMCGESSTNNYFLVCTSGTSYSTCIR